MPFVLLEVMFLETETPPGSRKLGAAGAPNLLANSRPRGPFGVWHAMQCAIVAR